MSHQCQYQRNLARIADEHDLGTERTEGTQIGIGQLPGFVDDTDVGDVLALIHPQPARSAPAVVTGDSRRWHHLAAGPHCAAPEALIAAYPDAVTRLRLPCTWRLGPETTSLIQPAFYAELPFTSAHQPRCVQLAGDVLPELAALPVVTLAGPGDPGLATAAADRVRELLQHGLVSDETGATRALASTDLAVITPHVEQASAVASRLSDIPGVLIGTANQAQGLEREAVVVIHPLAGYRETPSFATDPGRLCVALSRHRAHATVIVDLETQQVLRHAVMEDAGNTALPIQQYVLERLLAASD